MNTHESYVSLETAKMLKEAGFNWECREYYHNFITTGWSLCFDDNYINWQQEGDNYLSAPTLDVAQRWLREVKNVDVTVSRAMAWNQFYYTIEHEENRTAKVDVMSLNDDLWWFKYEDAQEAGIKKALELILEKGE